MAEAFTFTEVPLCYSVSIPNFNIEKCLRKSKGTFHEMYKAKNTNIVSLFGWL